MDNDNATQPAPILVTVPNACRLTGLGRTKIFELLAEGKLASVQIGRRRLVKYQSILALADGAA